jgi:NAD(P)-dependent dehydrogenase (short-subunit alcohol dehydrogenase family)
MELANQTALVTGGTTGISPTARFIRADPSDHSVKSLVQQAGKVAVLFLASPRSSFITGSTLPADGGGTAI